MDLMHPTNHFVVVEGLYPYEGEAQSEGSFYLFRDVRPEHQALLESLGFVLVQPAQPEPEALPFAPAPPPAQPHDGDL